MLTQSVQPHIRITRDGMIAVALLLLAAAAWAGLLTVVAAALLMDNFHAALAAWIDGLDLHLPLIGPLSGDGLLTRVIDKLGMLSFAIIPVLLLEAAVVGARDSSVWRMVRGRSVSSLTDFAIYALNALGLWKYACILLTFGAVLAANFAASSVVGATGQFQLRIHTGSAVIDAALAFLVFTFCDYWNHRLQHMHPLWPLHRMHHAAEEMTVLTLWRQHPSISAIEPFIKLWPLALFDVSAQAVAISGMVTVAYEHLIHSNVRWNWGWFGRWVLIPPSGHRLHHHIDPVCQGKNLGIPVLWDRLFGTWDGRTVLPNERLGIAEVPYNRGYPFREIWRDQVDFFAALVRCAKGLAGR